MMKVNGRSGLLIPSLVALLAALAQGILCAAPAKAADPVFHPRHDRLPEVASRVPIDPTWRLDGVALESGDLPADRVDATAYTINLTIQRDESVRGVATIEMVALQDDLGRLPMALFEDLTVESAELRTSPDGPGIPLQIEKAPRLTDKDKEFEYRHRANFALVFPEPLRQGDRFTLVLTYQGEGLLEATGMGSYMVKARSSWYPNANPLHDWATFDLTFCYPKKMKLVATGAKARPKRKGIGGKRCSRWVATEPLLVAGFNYGTFDTTDVVDEDTGVHIYVDTQPGTPDEIRELVLAQEGLFGTGSETSLGLASIPRIRTKDLAEKAMTDAQNSLRLFQVYFGPAPFKQLRITQQPSIWFGQSWPGLIFIPYAALLDATVRNQLGINAFGWSDFYDLVEPHEVAHQWFGQYVGAASERDVWMVEGFAEFAAGLYSEFLGGYQARQDFWESAGGAIMLPTEQGVIPNDVGPLTTGRALETDRTQGTMVLLYKKGAYVLWMLRKLMENPKAKNATGKDARFIAMMKDVTKTFARRNMSTEDFKEIVERHMTPAMDAAGDGTMDWFFNQWIYSTDAPSGFDIDASYDPTAGPKGKLYVTLAQKGVPDEFLTPLWIYLDFGGKTAPVQLGRVVTLRGTRPTRLEWGIKLPKTPKSVLVNAQGEVLVRGS